MKWMKFRIKTVVDAEDLIISELYDRGLEGAQIEDRVPLSPLEKERMFVDIPPEPEADDGVAYLSFFVEMNADGFLDLDGERADQESVLSKIEEALSDVRDFMEIGEGTVTVSETEDVDWINNWKQYFHQFCIDDILVIPSWEKVEEEDSDKMIIHIDPGTAFGTGMHETTQLCIRALRKYVNEDTRILDVGCGSGILGMLALKFGALYSVGTDLDPCAIDATHENMEANGIGRDRYEVMIGNLIDDPDIKKKAGFECYDIVVANILADVLLALTPVVVDQMKPGAVYITSGIIDEKESVVVEAVKAAGLEVLEVTRQGEWVSVSARKNR